MTVDRFILTGPPGSGKTTMIRHLAEDEPWSLPSFVDAIVETQKDRQIGLGNSARIQFYDRSPICTLVLARWLGHPESDAVRLEIERIRRERVYRSEVFFVRSLGFVTPTEARRITLADSIQRVETIKRSVELFRDPGVPFPADRRA